MRSHLIPLVVLFALHQVTCFLGDKYVNKVSHYRGAPLYTKRKVKSIGDVNSIDIALNTRYAMSFFSPKTSPLFTASFANFSLMNAMIETSEDKVSRGTRVLRSDKDQRLHFIKDEYSSAVEQDVDDDIDIDLAEEKLLLPSETAASTLGGLNLHGLYRLDTPLLFNDDDEMSGDKDTQSTSSSTRGFGDDGAYSLAIQYLKNELCIDEEVLMNMLLKYSWIMYLRVDTNLRPTVDVLKSFGFRGNHIKQMISVVPSILAINHQWTLPEKLISLQTMFSLTKGGLTKLCVEQPLLLTCSIERNLEISQFFSDEIQLSPLELKLLVTKSPELTMIGLPVLSACWEVLIDIYHFTKAEAKQLVIRCPTLLSRQLLKNGKKRIYYYVEELGLSIPGYVKRTSGTDSPSPPTNMVTTASKTQKESTDMHTDVDSEDSVQSKDTTGEQAIDYSLNKAALRFPALLYMDVDVFLRPNVEVLQTYLHCDTDSLLKLIGVFPQLLGHNPKTLERYCKNALKLLSGSSDYDLDPSNMSKTSRKISVKDNKKNNDKRDVDGEENTSGKSVLLSESEMGQAVFTSLTDGMSLEASLESTSAAVDLDSETTEGHQKDTNSTRASLIIDETTKHIYHGYEGLDLIADLVDAAETEVLHIRERFDLAMKEVDALLVSRTTDTQLLVIDNNDVALSGGKGGDIHEEGFSRVKVDLLRLKRRVFRRRLLQRIQGSKKVSDDDDDMRDMSSSDSTPLVGDNDECSSKVELSEQLEQQIVELLSMPSLPSLDCAHHSNDSEAYHRVVLNSHASKMLLRACENLKLEGPKSISVTLSSPWILAYRPERSRRVLGALALSLGMSRGELSRMVGIYPRLLSLSPEGKLAQVLRVLTEAAGKMYVLSTYQSLQQLLADKLIELNTLQRDHIAAAEEQEEEKYMPFLPTVNVQKIKNMSVRRLYNPSSLRLSAEGDIDLALDITTAVQSEDLSIFCSSLWKDDDNAHEEETNTASSEKSKDILGDEEEDIEPVMVKVYRELCDTSEQPQQKIVTSSLSSIHDLRLNTMRNMVRTVVLRYPLILGTAMGRIENRLEELEIDDAILAQHVYDFEKPRTDTKRSKDGKTKKSKAKSETTGEIISVASTAEVVPFIDWGDVVNWLRRPDAAHKRFIQKFANTLRNEGKL